jgi:outer membrane lipoprotein-sorting protein
MKKTALTAALFLAAAFALQAQDASRPQDAGSIVRSSRDRIKADTMYTESTMALRKKNGSVSERTIKQYSKDGPEGKRIVIEFLRPASFEGVRFLTMETSGGADNRWIYLPKADSEPRRLAAADGSKSFQGTDFSNDDISSSSRNADLDVHTLLREENLNGSSCYVIESVPKDKSYQYSKMVQWIDKGNMVTVKIELYDKRSSLIKTLEITELREVQGRLTPMATRMTTIAAGTSTTITVNDIKYDEPLAESVFTREFLKTGRAR